MKKIIILLAVVMIPKLGFSQFKWDFGGSISAANYLGEMGGDKKTRQDFVADMKISQTRPCLNAFARYKWKPFISFKGAINYVRIEGNDALSSNPARNARNLSFRDNMIEAATTVEWYFYKSSDMAGRAGLRGSRKRVDFRAYLYGGAALLYFNPQAQYQSKWVNLAPLHTEGVSYSRLTFAVPMGIGMTYTINRHYRLGLDFGWRKTFTDYLDDASTTYKKATFDPTAPGYNPTAAALSNRNPELTTSPVDRANYGYSEQYNGPRFTKLGELNKRGDPTHKDNYLTANLSFSYVIKGKNKFYKQRYKSLNARRKVVKRKTRAKF